MEKRKRYTLTIIIVGIIIFIALIGLGGYFLFSHYGTTKNGNIYYLKNGNFSVYFPVYPTYLSYSETISKGNDAYANVYYTTYPGSDTNQFAVVYVASPFKDPSLSPQENLKEVVNYNGPGSQGNKIVSQTPTNINGFPAVNYTDYGPSEIDKSLIVYQSERDILKGSDLYQLVYYYYPGKEDKQLENTFFDSLTFGQSPNSIAVVSKIFYLQATSKIRSCASLSCDPPVGTYPTNSYFELPYATVNDLPEWVKVAYQDSNGTTQSGYINKVNFGENEVGSQNSTNTTTTDSSVGTLCNGISYSKCPTGQDFICPADGTTAYCQAPQQQNSTGNQSDVVSKLEPVVVEINCWSASGNGGTMGSGLSLSLNGTIYIVTNYHVLSEASSEYGNPTCYATYPEAPNWQYNPNYGDYSLTLVNYTYNPSTYQDMALFALGAPYQGSTPLINIPSIDNNDVYECSKNYNVSVGDDVIVLGYPAAGNFFGVSETVTHGKIAGVLPGPIYKFDGNIDHGNSGGVAIEDNGCFLGIPTWGMSGATGGIGYIQSYELALSALNQ